MHDTVLKLDLLGHVDPSALSMMSSLTGIKIQDVPLTDPEALSIFSSDKALKRKHKIALLENGAAGIPEFGTVISMKILQDTKPKKFADLLLVSGLSHGKEVWFGNSKNLVDSGEMKLSEVIGCRDDIMTYLVEKGISENQSFHIMEDVRKGKHVKKEYEVLMKAHNVPDYYIGACNKIKYMFPKAHATAYVMMAVRVAWFKINYPLEYYATYFTLRSKQYELETMMKTASEIYDRIEFFRTQVLKTKGKQKTKSKEGDIELTLQMALEMVERGYKFLNIDLNKSDATKFVIDREKNALIPPFIVINGVGETAAYSVLTARNERPFASRDDLLQRTKLSGTNVENLVALGALDTLQENDHISLFSF
jgi:DNA polymerase-3 subunit alpha (Gram-positive type)